MQVSRRTAIRQFLTVSAGITFLHGCKGDKASIALKNIKVTGEQEKLLAEISEAIIPKTDSPGAKDLSAHLFALKMVDDLYKKEDQDRYINGLNAFPEYSKKLKNKDFLKCTPEEREAILLALDKGPEDAGEALNYFYGTHKRFTLQAYTTSQFYLTEVRHFKLVPGPYKGCVSVNA